MSALSALPRIEARADVPRSSSQNALDDFVDCVEQRVQQYLVLRTDNEEQSDHLRHVADRTRWMYYSEMHRTNPGISVRISEHEDGLIRACAYSHDMGKWIPRDELRALLPSDPTARDRVFTELKLTSHQAGLFSLAVRRRLQLAKDGYTPEYDSAHHLVSAFMLATDESLGFHALDLDDQVRLVNMIVGHQFGGYFKESLLALSLRGRTDISTGMLVDISRPDRVEGDLLASCFHDADISDMLFIGSLERRPNREDIFHTGGLVKILMINLTNRINDVPNSPSDLAGCIRSVQGTVASACKEFMTPTAVEHGYPWRREARRFLALLQEKPAYDRLNTALLDRHRLPMDRLLTVRSLTRLHAREFLNRPDEE